MSDTQSTYFGIDLGTTYSAISYVDDTGRPTVVRNLDSDETTPSVVYFENAGNVVVGSTAKGFSRLYPDRVVSLVKRQMGREREWLFDGETYTPESISALILRQLAQDAEAFTGQKVEKVVITVPAYFGMLERDATRNAGRIAGLDVVGIVPEPVAAALQYDVVADAAGKTVLVYDLGGGTFDTTVIHIDGGSIEVICTDGDQELGGADWDERLIEYLLTEFRAQASPAEDPADDEEFMQELALIAETTKRQLTQVQSKNVPLRHAGAAAMVEVTRSAFEERTRDLLDRTVDYTKRTLATLAEKAPGVQIDEALLVGGATKMPMVAERLRAEFGWEPKLHDPDLSVAKGAALYAVGRAVWDGWDAGTTGGRHAGEPTGRHAGEPSGRHAGEPTGRLAAEEREQRIKDLSQQTSIPVSAIRSIAEKKVVTVLPKAFGVKLLDTDKPNWQADLDAASFVDHLVHANDQLPAGPVTLSAATVEDGQAAVTIEIYEQAGSEETRDLAGNKAVDHGSGEIGGLPNLPANSPIAISMTVDVDGQLLVRATEPSSGKELTIEVRVSLLSEDQVRAATRAISALTVKG